MASPNLSAELSAMQDIATLLHELDPATRTRVLHWIQERFKADAPPLAAATATASVASVELRVVPPPAKVADETLSVEALTDFFDFRGPKVQDDPAAQPQSVSGMLHEFVAEFQDLAREWNEESGEAKDDKADKADKADTPRLSVAS